MQEKKKERERENIYWDHENHLANGSNRVPSLYKKKKRRGRDKIADWLITCAKSSLHRHIRTYIHAYIYTHIYRDITHIRIYNCHTAAAVLE